MKNQIKLIACLVIATLFLSSSTFTTRAEKEKQKADAAVSLPSVDLQATQDSAPVTGQLVQTRADDPELSRHFRSYDLIRLDPESATAQIKNRGRLSLKTSKRDFDLQFTPHDLRAPDYSAQETGADGIARKLPKQNFNTFKGTVKGDSRAQARISIGSKGVEGAIVTGTERYFIQPARALSKTARSDEFVFYSIEDVTKTDDSCGVTLAEEVAAREEVAAAQSKTEITAELNSPITPSSLMKVVQLATDADSEYVATLGGTSQANAQIVNIMNMVDGIYQVEIGVTFTIVFQHTWTDSATDPYTATAASALLGEFRNHWNANFNQPLHSRDLAHLWTGKDLDGGTIGIASVGVVCRNATFSYGLSQIFPLSGAVDARTVVLTAHEMGHNFSASHTNQPTTQIPPDFIQVCDNSIMESGLGLNQGSSFCPFSRSQIVGHANAYGSCLSTAGAPPSNNCIETPIDGTLTANGSLSNSDCRSTQRGSNYFADQYSFNGVAGQRISITLVRTNGSFDPYLFLIGPDGFLVLQDDDGNGNNDSRLPSSGTIALPMTGKYVIEATSFAAGTTGDYTVTVSPSGCTLSATVSPGGHFGAAAGSGTIVVTASGSNCSSAYQVAASPVSANWLVPQTTTGSGSQSIGFTVAANSSTAGRRAFLVLEGVLDTGLPSTTSDDAYFGGLAIPITQSGTGPECSVTPIAFGQTLNGLLETSDCESPIRGAGFRADRYTFTATAGQQIAINVNSRASSDPPPIPDTFVSLIGPNGVVLLNDDDSGGGTNSRIPGGTGNLPLGVAGIYTIEVTGFETNDLGAYSLTLTGTAGATPTVQFSSPTNSVGEAGSTATVTVTRSGDTSVAGSVNYATSDSYAECNVINGQASAKCDYATAGGTLQFAAGETSKTILVSIINDGYVEGNETFTLSLGNASGLSIGSPSTTEITILENDGSPSNPFDTNSFFVRQQYLDFLLREPDTGGFNDWLTVLNNCNPGQGGLGSPAGCDRVHVSSGFFRSTEFGERGYWSYRYYHAVLGRRPQFAEFVPDMRRLSGSFGPGEEEAARAAFVADFMQRPEFTAIYAGLTNAGSAAQFIAKLEEKAQVTLPATVPPTQPGQPPQYGRAELIQKMQSGQFTAAQTLRAFIEQKVVFDAFFFRAFVAMQYFGYLLRDPEQAGYDDWVDVLTNGRGSIPAGDFRHLIFGFIYSVEYRQRFGP